MTEDQIIETMRGYVRDHVTDLRGALFQDPYRSDMFELALAARDANLEMPMERIRDRLLMHFDDNGGDLYGRASNFINNQLACTWDAWLYALKHG